MIGKKGSLDALLARRVTAGREAEQAEAALRSLVLASDDPGRRAESAAEVERALDERQRAQAVYIELGEECDRLAVAHAEGEVARVEAEISGLEAEHEQTLARLAEIAASLEDRHDRLVRARADVGKAARYSPGAEARLAALEQQERPVIEWWSQHRPLRPSEWPAGLKQQIAADVERRKQLRVEEQARSQRESEASLAAVGLTVEAARETFGLCDRSWPRGRVR